MATSPYAQHAIARPAGRLLAHIPEEAHRLHGWSTQDSALDTSADLKPPEPKPKLLAEQAALVFRVYDVKARGVLERPEMVAALSELGLLHGMSGKLIEEVLALDPSTSKAATYTLSGFLAMYERMAAHHSKLARDGRIRSMSLAPQPPQGAESNPQLRRVFGAYCNYAIGTSRLLISKAGPAMIAQQLHRLCLDINLVGEAAPLSGSSVDIAFIRCCSPSSRKLSYPQWLSLLAILSQESGWELFQVVLQHAHKLGTQGLPCTVDPITMMSAATHTPQLPQVPSSTRRTSPQHRASQAALRAAAASPGAEAEGLQGRRSRTAGGTWLDSPMQFPLALSLRASAPNLRLAEMEPDTMPGWLSEVLERLQLLEGEKAGAAAGADMCARLQALEEGLGHLQGVPSAERQMSVIASQLQLQIASRAQAEAEKAVARLESPVIQATEAAEAAAAALGCMPPEGSELANELAALRARVQEVQVLQGSDSKALGQRAALFDEQLEAMRADRASQGAALAALMQQLQALQADRARQEESAAAVVQRLQVLEAAYATRPEADVAVVERLQTLERAATMNGEEEAARRQQAFDADVARSGLEARLAVCEERLKAHDGDASSLNAQLHDQSFVQVIEAKLQGLTSMLDLLQKEVSQLKARSPQDGKDGRDGEDGKHDVSSHVAAEAIWQLEIRLAASEALSEAQESRIKAACLAAESAKEAADRAGPAAVAPCEDAAKVHALSAAAVGPQLDAEQGQQLPRARAAGASANDEQLLGLVSQLQQQLQAQEKQLQGTSIAVASAAQAAEAASQAAGEAKEAAAACGTWVEAAKVQMADLARDMQQGQQRADQAAAAAAATEQLHQQMVEMQQQVQAQEIRLRAADTGREAPASGLPSDAGKVFDASVAAADVRLKAAETQLSDMLAKMHAGQQQAEQAAAAVKKLQEQMADMQQLHRAQELKLKAAQQAANTREAAGAAASPPTAGPADATTPADAVAVPVDSGGWHLQEPAALMLQELQAKVTQLQQQVNGQELKLAEAAAAAGSARQVPPPGVPGAMQAAVIDAAVGSRLDAAEAKVADLAAKMQAEQQQAQRAAAAVQELKSQVVQLQQGPKAAAGMPAAPAPGPGSGAAASAGVSLARMDATEAQLAVLAAQLQGQMTQLLQQQESLGKLSTATEQAMQASQLRAGLQQLDMKVPEVQQQQQAGQQEQQPNSQQEAAAMQRLEKKVQELQQQLEEVLKQPNILQLEKQLQDLQQQLSGKDKQPPVGQSQQPSMEHQAAMQQLEKKVQDLQQQLTEILQQQQQQQLLAGTREDILQQLEQQLKASQAQLQQEVQHMEQRLRESQEQVTRQVQQLAANLEKQQSQLNQEVQQVEQHLMDMQAQLKQEVAGLQAAGGRPQGGDSTSGEEELHELASQLAALAAGSAALSSKLSEQGAAISDCVQRVQGLESRASDASKDKKVEDAINAARVAADQALAKAAAALAAANQGSVQVSQGLAGAQGQINSLQAEVDKLLAQMTAAGSGGAPGPAAPADPSVAYTGQLVEALGAQLQALVKDVEAIKASELETEIQQLAMMLGEVAGRFSSMEHAGYLKAEDFKEAERQLHAELEAVKSSIGSGMAHGQSQAVAGPDDFATWEAVRHNEFVASQNFEALREHLNSLGSHVVEVEGRLGEVQGQVKSMSEVQEVVLVKLARQVDYLQTVVKHDMEDAPH